MLTIVRGMRLRGNGEAHPKTRENGLMFLECLLVIPVRLGIHFNSDLAHHAWGAAATADGFHGIALPRLRVAARHCVLRIIAVLRVKIDVFVPQVLPRRDRDLRELWRRTVLSCHGITAT